MNHETPAAAASHIHDGHADTPAAPDKGDAALATHCFGACQAFVAPSPAIIAHDHGSILPRMIAAATLLPKAAATRLFRPPRAGFSA